MFKSGERQHEYRNEVLEYFVSFLMTDDERAELYGLPEGCRMRENAKVFDPDRLECGKFVWIGANAKLDASGGLSIGEHTSLGGNTGIWTHDSSLANLVGANETDSRLIYRDAVTIGKNCFVGAQSIVTPGVDIGNQSIVLPLSVVRDDVEPRTIVQGNPAEKVGKVNKGLLKLRLQNYFPEMTSEERDAVIEDFEQAK